MNWSGMTVGKIVGTLARKPIDHLPDQWGNRQGAAMLRQAGRSRFDEQIV